MTIEDVNSFKQAAKALASLREEFKQKSQQYDEVYDKFSDQIDDWFENFCKTDEKIKELDICDDSAANINYNTSMSLHDDTVNFSIVEEFYGDFTQHFDCTVSVDDIPAIVNGEKSIWDFNPDTKTRYF